MIDPLEKEINVEEIMERIREEIKRRKGLSQPGAFQENAQGSSQPQLVQSIPPSPPPANHLSVDHSFDRFLWEYGRRYKKVIKKIPILKSIAQKEHQRLRHKFIFSSSNPAPSYSSPVNFNSLSYYINYHGFLEQAKRGEGIKGRLKFHLFKTIRYFGWWQEQINRALYQELVDQKARIEEKERSISEQYQQQVSHLREELNKRDSMLSELNHHLISLTQSRNEIYQNLENQRLRIEESEKQFREVQTQQFLALKEFLEERIKSLEDKLSFSNQAYNILQQELVDQNNKIEDVQRWFTSNLHQKIEEMRQEINKQDKRYEEIFDRLSDFHQAGEAINQKLTLQEKHLEEFGKNMKQSLAQGLEVIQTKLIQTQGHLEKEMGSLNHQLSKIIELKSNLPKIFQEMMRKEEQLSNTLYTEFENRFRGTREEIKERSNVYLPYVKVAAERTGTLLTLDLGCGRGEWVELLKENGFIATGVDSNNIMAKECQKKGLDVIEQDAIEYLNSQPSNRFAVITGFHLLEHLSIREIVTVLNETFRVLLSGGIAIFETPNPENVIVATRHFYLDPTHRHLLPPELLNFLFQSVGFKKNEIMRLQPLNFSTGEETESPNVKLILTQFNQSQDYSIIGYKE